MPIPRVASCGALTAADFRGSAVDRRRAQSIGRHLLETIGERFARDRHALLPLPEVPYAACDTCPTRVTSLSLVRYRRNDYSVPTAYGHREVLVKGYVDHVVIVCGGDAIARHPPHATSVKRLIFDPLHYLALLTSAIDRGARIKRAPLAGLGAARRTLSCSS